MPVLNEERHLAEAVAHILSQDYPGEVELVIALGPSKDRTDEIAAGLCATDPRVRTVPNPSGRTPAGLNAAIAASRHDVVVRVDGHGLLAPGYLRTAVVKDGTMHVQAGAGIVADSDPAYEQRECEAKAGALLAAAREAIARAGEPRFGQ